MKRKLTRTQLRRLLLREAAAFSGEVAKMGNNKFNQVYANRLRSAGGSVGNADGSDDAPVDRSLDAALSTTFREISEAIASLQDQINKLEAKRLGKAAGMDPDDPGV